ncbi:MAG: peptidoglycan DD-metalloendopeptidase family protein [Bacteroidota bacterium]
MKHNNTLNNYFTIVLRRLFVCSTALLFFVQLAAQTPTLESLEYKRERLLREIEATNSELEQTQANKANTFQQYLALKKRIRKRQELLNTLRAEVTYIDKSIDRNGFVITSLNDDMERLKEDYARMLRTAYRQKMNNSRWIFLLSSNNLNNAVQRWRYLKQYDDYRKKQAALILETKSVLELKVQQLEQQKAEKQDLISSTDRQRNLLGRELTQKNDLLGKLKASEAKLANNLEDQQRQKSQLDNAIAAAIAAEAEKNKNNIAAEDKSKIIREANEFKAMFGDLPWPVANGKIIKAFGRHQHPAYENVVTENNGIDIAAGPSASVQAVYPGRVVGKQFIPGNQNMVILAHGNYYTVYSNLASVHASIQKGVEVKSGQNIGRLSKRDSELHFEIWKEKQRLNPEQWIR